ncbi:MAG: cellulase family glycosylhydrolase [Lachnospiraceae bacterium]|nr:cellulase family glycosylhydrolase [Lachnospiraceae bacterium]
MDEEIKNDTDAQEVKEESPKNETVEPEKKRLSEKIVMGIILVLLLITLAVGIPSLMKGFGKGSGSDLSNNPTSSHTANKGSNTVQTSQADATTAAQVAETTDKTEDITTRDALSGDGDSEEDKTSAGDETSEVAENETEDESAENAGDTTGEDADEADETTAQASDEASSIATTIANVATTVATTVAPTTVASTTVAPTTVVPTTVAPTTVAPTTVAPTTVPATTVAPVQGESGTPYGNHGKLTVVGSNIVDKNGDIYQLKGVSTHGINWFPGYVNKAGFQTMRDEWGINIVRLAMYTAEYNGYTSGGDKTALKNLVISGVDAATELGLYVIIDWHVLNDDKGSTDSFFHTSDAIAFFNEMSSRYAGNDNVLYEICNEPNGSITWEQCKAYAEQVIPVIRANDPDAIIIVGNPTWSQRIDLAMANPITGYSNIMYTLHFYAGTHKDDLINRMVSCVSAGFPVFVSEYGICDASGNGGIDTANADKWMSYIDQYHIGSCIWSLCNKGESASLISSSCNKTSAWTASDLATAGTWFVTMMKGSTSGLGTTAGSSTTETTAAQTTAQNTTAQSTTAQQTTQATTTAVSFGQDDNQATVSGTNGSLTIAASNSSSWMEGSSYCRQYSVKVSNSSSSEISFTSITLTFSTNVTVNNVWNVNGSANGNTYTCTFSSSDWNSKVAANGELEVFGGSFLSSTNFTLTGISVN